MARFAAGKETTHLPEALILQEGDHGEGGKRCRLSLI